MWEKGIQTVFHYVPLHNSPMGLRCARTQGELRITEDLSARLLRLPLWLGIEEEQDEIILAIIETLKESEHSRQGVNSD